MKAFWEAWEVVPNSPSRRADCDRRSLKHKGARPIGRSGRSRRRCGRTCGHGWLVCRLGAHKVKVSQNNLNLYCCQLAGKCALYYYGRHEGAQINYQVPQRHSWFDSLYPRSKTSLGQNLQQRCWTPSIWLPITAPSSNMTVEQRRRCGQVHIQFCSRTGCNSTNRFPIPRYPWSRNSQPCMCNVSLYFIPGLSRLSLSRSQMMVKLWTSLRARRSQLLPASNDPALAR